MAEEVKETTVAETVPTTPEATPEATPEVDETSLEDAEKSTGIKDAGHNQDAVDLAMKTTDEESEPKPEVLPSFFVEDDDRIKVEVDILFDKETGKLISVARKGLLNQNDFKVLGYVTESFEFKPAGYEDMSGYRQRCSVFRRDAGRMLTDPISVRNYLVVWHLKDWSMRDRQGNKIPLGFTEKGALDDGSIQTVYKMNTTLLDVVLTLFEKDMMM